METITRNMKKMTPGLTTQKHRGSALRVARGKRHAAQRGTERATPVLPGGPPGEAPSAPGRGMEAPSAPQPTALEKH